MIILRIEISEVILVKISVLKNSMLMMELFVVCEMIVGNVMKVRLMLEVVILVIFVFWVWVMNLSVVNMLMLVRILNLEFVKVIMRLELVRLVLCLRYEEQVIMMLKVIESEKKMCLYVDVQIFGFVSVFQFGVKNVLRLFIVLGRNSDCMMRIVNIMVSSGIRIMFVWLMFCFMFSVMMMIMISYIIMRGRFICGMNWVEMLMFVMDLECRKLLVKKVFLFFGFQVSCVENQVYMVVYVMMIVQYMVIMMQMRICYYFSGFVVWCRWWNVSGVELWNWCLIVQLKNSRGMFVVSRVYRYGMRNVLLLFLYVMQGNFQMFFRLIVELIVERMNMF